MAIIFEHAVKYAGKYYLPNTPIEEATEAAQSAGTAEVKRNTPAKTTTARKAVRGGRKGDA